MTAIAIAGAAGRMGKAIIRFLPDFEDLRLAAAIENAGHPELGRDAGEAAGIGKLDVKITEDIDTVVHSDVLIDFSFHEATVVNVEAAAAHRRAVVIGTTGLTAAEGGRVARAADKVPIVWAPNMSIGMNLLFAAVRKAAEVLGNDYRRSIDETHHVHKKDAPSGTALRFGEILAETRGRELRDLMVQDPEDPADRELADKIVICSHREGEVVGDHTVAFENPMERIEFTHRARTRDTFARGALFAARWVCTRKPRLYDMQDVLGLR